MSSERPVVASERYQTTVKFVEGEIVVSESFRSSEIESCHVIPTLYAGVQPSAALIGFASRRINERWGLEETRRFYAALRQCGTDFTLMQSLFPGRSQRELKNKYLREERYHSNLVEMALEPRVALPLLLQARWKKAVSGRVADFFDTLPDCSLVRCSKKRGEVTEHQFTESMSAKPGVSLPPFSQAHDADADLISL